MNKKLIIVLLMIVTGCSFAVTAKIWPENEIQQSVNSKADIYYDFIENEKANPTFTLTDFKYAFVTVDSFDGDLLVIKDEWNMYLLYTTGDNSVERVKGKNGDPLTLFRMDYAYSVNGKLYVRGSCGVPESTYFGEVFFNNGVFEVNYLAESDTKSDGSVVYLDSYGNEISKKVHHKTIRNYLCGTRKLRFKSKIGGGKEA